MSVSRVTRFCPKTRLILISRRLKTNSRWLWAMRLIRYTSIKSCNPFTCREEAHAQKYALTTRHPTRRRQRNPYQKIEADKLPFLLSSRASSAMKTFCRISRHPVSPLATEAPKLWASVYSPSSCSSRAVSFLERANLKCLNLSK